MTRWRARVVAHVETWRPYTSCYVGLVGLAGAALAPGTHNGWRMLAAWAIPTMGWLAGLYGGDYFDRELDAIAKPQRPIPSGRMRPATALAAMICLIGLGAAWTVALNWLALALVACATVVGLSYNGYFKARGLAGNLVRGTLTSFAFLFGAAMAQGWPDVTLMAVAVVFALQDGSSNLVGTLRDVDGDRQGGYRTFPVRHGTHAAVRAVGVLVAAWSVLAVATAWAGGRPVNAWTALLLCAAMAAAWLVVAALHRSRDAMSRAFALRMHEVLCLQRIVLALAFAAWGAGAILALCVGVPALAVTWVSQVRLRHRHEFPVVREPAVSGRA